VASIALRSLWYGGSLPNSDRWSRLRLGKIAGARKERATYVKQRLAVLFDVFGVRASSLNESGEHCVFRFLKILFGKGIDASPEEMVAILTGQMYPGDKLLAQIADLQARQNNTVEPETIFAAACGCSMMALSGAAHGTTSSVPLRRK
jgi:hypothetical protein